MIGPREWLRRWWQARLQPVEQWTLSQRNVYIVPTRAGLAFGLTLILLLLASINYQLNLGYALTFLLAGSALASMHMTHGSLRGLAMHIRPPAPAHVGGQTLIELIVDNRGGVRHGLGFGVQADRGAQALAWVEVEACSQSTVVVACTAERRGHSPLPLLRVESRFPFGLFCAWTVWRPAGRRWIYPAAETPALPLPPADAQAGNGRDSRSAIVGEFEGVRPWRRGDGLRQVVWKKVARTGELISRDSREADRRELWLDWLQTPPVDTEARLSRLTAWVLAAEAGGLRYGLRLPGRDLACSDHPAQRDLALQALAEYPG